MENKLHFIPETTCVRVYNSEGGKHIGDITLSNGRYVYWPHYEPIQACWPEWILKDLYLKIKELNFIHLGEDKVKPC